MAVTGMWDVRKGHFEVAVREESKRCRTHVGADLDVRGSGELGGKMVV